mmetsp:Transcript_146590/g.365540  ORF Transcript_146590/g.365540 Transcript_146590/m.365540 type:complete len:363 (-) Transcript_146590:218-1306(-)
MMQERGLFHDLVPETQYDVDELDPPHDVASSRLLGVGGCGRRVAVLSLVGAAVLLGVVAVRGVLVTRGQPGPLPFGGSPNGFVLEAASPTTPTPQKQAPMQEFYMYRAAAKGALDDFPFGNINTGNMDGVIWYLMNEVVTMYTAGTRCPRKFNISLIHRFKVRTMATPELYAEGMNMGTRFAFDEGLCKGRCFPKNMCTGQGDCRYHYKRYGFVPGCNNFYDHYPFPDYDTPAKQGIWYALPLAGRCDRPTGEHDCTWSFEHAGEITLEELEAVAPGGENCCDGTCSDFWIDQFNEWKTTWRVNQALDLFKRKYPDAPRDLGYAKCDFQWWKWYSKDPWPKRDPWAEAKKKAAAAKSQEAGA